MNNIKVFPSFCLADNYDQKDAEFLKEIKSVRDTCEALYVNFSYLDYETDKSAQSKTMHYVTYPMEWIGHYLKSHYIEIDPFFKMDYRLLSVIDWQDFMTNENVDSMFTDFQKFGLGNSGITLISPLANNKFGALSLTFEVSKANWIKLREEKISDYKILGDLISRKYLSVFYGSNEPDYNITQRERDCLYWVAKGKTDDQIAEILSIGKWTVVAHLKSAKYKLSCTNRAATIAKSVSLGLIDYN